MDEHRPALAFEAVSAGYGETAVLEDVGFAVAGGESASVVGRNGVGKTTLLATAMGHTVMRGGAIRLGGLDITRLGSFRRARAGIGYVPQEREIFPTLTLMENLRVAQRGDRWSPDDVFALFPSLKERRTHRGDQLSGGEQQMLSVGRALMGGPSILLMDEPTEGLAPVIVEQLVEALSTLRDEAGLTLVLVEQNTRVAFEFSPRCMVMDRGRIVYDGASAELAGDPDLLDSLIGVSAGESSS